MSHRLALPLLIALVGCTSTDDKDETTNDDINSPPEIVSAIPPQAAKQGEAFSYDVASHFTDPDGDPLSFAMAGTTSGTGLSIQGSLVGGIPTNTDFLASPNSLVITASDPDNESVELTFLLSVANDNDPPVLSTNIANVSTVQGQPFNYDISSFFSDPDGDPLRFEALGLPEGTGITFDEKTGVFGGTTLSIDAEALQPVQITVNAQDTSSAQATGTFLLTVTNVNDPPLNIVDIPEKTALYGEDFVFGVGSYFLDPDGDDLKYGIQGLPAGTGLDIDADTGVISGTPNDFDLAAVQPQLLTVVCTDGQVLGDAPFLLTVKKFNSPPVVLTEPGTAALTQGVTFTVDFSPNFGDAEQTDLDFVLEGLPADSGLTFDPETGILIGAPTNALAKGLQPLVLTITADDGVGGKVTATYTVTIVDVNDPPQIKNNIPKQVGIQNGNFLLDISKRFIDPDDDAMTFEADGLPVGTGLTFNEATGVFSGQFTNDDALAAQPLIIVVTAKDGKGGTIQNSFELQVFNVNDPVELVNPVADTGATLDLPLQLKLGSHFADIDGDVITFSIEGLPDGTGLVLDPTTGTLGGAASQADVDASPSTLMIVGRDPSNTSASDKFVLTVVADNDAPEVTTTPEALTATQGSPFVGDIGQWVTDPDGQALSWEIEGLPAGTGLSIDDNGVLTGTPSNEDAKSSPLVLTLTATDPFGGFVTFDVDLTVEDVNDAPVAIDDLDPLSAKQGDAVSVDLAPLFIDIDGDTLTYGVDGLPAGTGLAITGSVLAGILDVADAAAAQPLELTLWAEDSAGGRAEVPWTVQVLDINDAPEILIPLEDLTVTLNLSYGPRSLVDDVYDADNDVLAYFLSGLPSGTGLVFDGATGLLSGAANAADLAASPSALLFRARDTSGAEVSQELFLTVIEDNLPPVRNVNVADTTGTQGQALTLDTGASFSDADGDDLRFKLTGLPAESGLSFNTDTGVLSGTPTNALALVSPLTLSLQVDDQRGGFNSDVFVLTIVNVNDAPIPATDPLTVAFTEDAATSLDLTSLVSDPDGDLLTFTVAGLPDGSGLTFDALTGILSGTPGDADVAASPFTLAVEAKDASATTAVDLVVTVTNINDTPVVSGSLTFADATEDEAASYPTASVFSDIEGDVLSYTVTGLPVGTGLAIDPATGVISGSPVDADVAASPLALVVRASDGQASGEAPATLTVIGINDTPVVGEVPEDAVAHFGVALDIDLASAFSDVDGPSLSFTVTGLVPDSGLTFEDGHLSGIPNADDVDAGDYVLTVTADDGSATAEYDFGLTVEDRLPIVLLTPADDAVDQGTTPTFTWEAPETTWTDVFDEEWPLTGWVTVVLGEDNTAARFAWGLDHGADPTLDLAEVGAARDIYRLVTCAIVDQGFDGDGWDDATQSCSPTDGGVPVDDPTTPGAEILDAAGDSWTWSVLVLPCDPADVAVDLGPSAFGTDYDDFSDCVVDNMVAQLGGLSEDQIVAASALSTFDVKGLAPSFETVATLGSPVVGLESTVVIEGTDLDAEMVVSIDGVDLVCDASGLPAALSCAWTPEASGSFDVTLTDEYGQSTVEEDVVAAHAYVDSIDAEYSWCTIQFVETSGGDSEAPYSDSVGATVDVYGQLYLDDETEGVPPDFAAGISAELGLSPLAPADADLDPTTSSQWTWTPMDPFLEQTLNLNNDEYLAVLDTAGFEAGEYRLAVRFSRNGADWQVCDTTGHDNDENGYLPADLVALELLAP